MNTEEMHMSQDRSPRIHVGIVRAEKIRFYLNGRYRAALHERAWSGKAEASIRHGHIEVRGPGERIISGAPGITAGPEASSATGDSPARDSSHTPDASRSPDGSYSAGNSYAADHSHDVIRFDPEDEESACFELSGVVIGIGFHWEQEEDQKFQGSLVLKVLDDRIQVINEISLERYLVSVISSEMSANSSPEFLKAHAIISRSWLMAQIEKRDAPVRPGNGYVQTRETGDELIRWYDREDHQEFDVCADDHCQRYQGITRAHNPEVTAAVKGTAGEVLLYGNRICDARFSKCCGGVTELFENCWEDVPHPYLQSVPDRPGSRKAILPGLENEASAEAYIQSRPEAFCNTTDVRLLRQVLNDYDLASKDFFRWKVSFTQEEFAALIRGKSGIDFGEIIDLVPVERGASARLVRLKISGTKRTMTIGKELEIRRWLSPSHLYSSAFTVRREEFRGRVPGRFILHGAGWGHGVGLCQIGAAVMADRGYTNRQILGHYYRNATIRKRYG
jgi:stage II sporulation protein D